MKLEYTIDTSLHNGIDWNAKGNLRVIQNLYNLIKTFKYEIAYGRTIGLSSDLLHNPINQIEAQLPSEIINMISIYEPRAKVKKVEILGFNDDGDIDYKVVVEI